MTGWPGPTSRWATIGRNVLGVIIIVVFLVGVYYSARGLWQFILSIQFPHEVLAPVADFLKKAFFEHLDGWVTAIATTALWVATVAILRTSDRQAALDAPFLHLEMTLLGPEQPQLEGIAKPSPAYDARWQEQDLRDPHLGPYVAEEVPEYVHLTITNEQQKPYGVAARVVVNAILMFPSLQSDSGVQNMPRRIDAPVIGANRYVTGPIFNVGGLPWFHVGISGVRYADILQQSRQAAYGTGILSRAVDGSVTVTNTIYEPAKGELT